jgi:uncharacterized protein
MQRQFTSSITYFLQEGRENLPECLKIAFHVAKKQNIGKVVIFTARGEGVMLALENYCALDDYRDIKLVAVAFSPGRVFYGPDGSPMEVRISDEAERLMSARQVPIIRAHLPFDPIEPRYQNRGALARDMSLVESVLNVFGGGMSLCIQAAILACDSGAVAVGEHIISMTADTAILVQAAPTARMLRELTIREILCKPAILSLGRSESQIEGGVTHKVLGLEPSNEPEPLKTLPEGGSEKS